MTKVISRLLCSVLLWVLVSPAVADQHHMAVGTYNTVFQLSNGTYAELFPDDGAAGSDAQVLALDVYQGDGSRHRWLVPGSESSEQENSEVLVYDRKSDRVYLFWETVVYGIHPTLYLTSFDGSEWGELIEFIGSPFSRKHSLQLVVSRVSASHVPQIDGPEITLLHVFWREERSGRSSDVMRWAPIVIVDGEYLGSTPVYDLDTFQASDGLPEEAAISPGLEGVLRAESGRDSQSTVVGYLNPITHRLDTLEIEFLAPVLATLADKARLELIPIGHRAKSLEELADLVAAKILELADDFHPAVLSYMAEKVRELILGSGHDLNQQGLSALAEQVWNQIIAVGSAIEETGLAADEAFRIVEIAQPGQVGGARHLLKVKIGSDREAPEVGGEATLWLSESARHVLVTWEDEARIYFRESLDEGGWSGTGSIDLGGELERAQIYRTLSDRIRTR